MVNTEQLSKKEQIRTDYNILNIVVNTELDPYNPPSFDYYNILNIVVNTELTAILTLYLFNYNILNIVVNTEQKTLSF